MRARTRLAVGDVSVPHLVGPRHLKIVGNWFSLANLIQFQPARLVFHISYFGLGIYAYAKKWFTSGIGLGRPWVWGTIGIVALLTVVLSCGVSRYVLRRYPRLVTIGLLGVSVLLAVST